MHLKEIPEESREYLDFMNELLDWATERSHGKLKTQPAIQAAFRLEMWIMSDMEQILE